LETQKIIIEKNVIEKALREASLKSDKSNSKIDKVIFLEK
jgi:hypothetical protein